MSAMPRGIRNNNPGNIRLSGVKWVGQAFGADPDFVTFDKPENGIRAIAKTLYSYWLDDGIHTIRGAIYRWAPATENNSAAYAADVAKQVGLGPDEFTGLNPILHDLVVAIIAHENANYAYDAGVIEQGLSLAGFETNEPQGTAAA